MKNFFVLALCSTVLFNVSCSKDEEGGSEKEITGSLSVEEGKTQLEDNSIKLLDKINEFKNNDALNEIVELAEFLSPANSSKSSKSSKIKKYSLNTISNIADLQSDDSNVVSFNRTQSINVLDDTSLIDDFNEEKGIYQWNTNSEEFDKTGNSDDVIYNIAYNGKNAIFRVTDFETTITGEDDEEIPTLVKASLKIDNTTVFSQNFSASFQNEKLIPASINNTTIIGGFVFVTSYTNSNNTSVNQSFEFKIDDCVITGFNYTANGNFNDEDGDVEDILDNATSTFQFLDAKLTVSAKDDNLNSDDELTIDEQIALLNTNTDAVLSINNKLIATSEFYKDEDTYMDYFYDPSTGSFIEEEVTEDIVNARFLFEDETSSDFDTYFEGSFTELEDKFDDVFDAYEDLFGDVDIDN